MSTSVTDILPADTATILMAPDVGCNVVGLYLEGSGWSVEVSSPLARLVAVNLAGS